MAAVAVASGSQQAAAHEPTPNPTPIHLCVSAHINQPFDKNFPSQQISVSQKQADKNDPVNTLDPKLVMAARRGDWKELEHLLQLKGDDGSQDRQGQNTRPEDEGSGTPTTAAAASTTTSAAPSTSISQPHTILEMEQGQDTPPLPLPLPLPPRHDDDAAALPTQQPPAVPPAAGSSAVLVLLDADGVTMEGDSLLHVVASSGDNWVFTDCVDVIVRNKEKKGGAGAKRQALEARNNKGDTPLHCAARAGNDDMIPYLVGRMKEAVAAEVKTFLERKNECEETELQQAVSAATEAAVKVFVRRKNRCGETALHQAVRAASKDAIDKLLAVDPELAAFSQEEDDAGAASIGKLLAVHPELAACIREEDDAGAAACSPFFLAVSLWGYGEDDEMDIARHLFDKTSRSIRSNLSYYCSRPDGRNVLHAAAHRGQALPMILEWLLDMKLKEGSSSLSLISRLTSQRDRKHNGSTPLHLAASLEGWPGAGFLSRRFPQVWPTGESMATLLLDANESTAYQADDDGTYPIHVAAWSGYLAVVKMLLERCPDCATLRDGQGRTFLHVATEKKERHAVVEYVCRKMPQRWSSMILNAQDSNGDTALHYAVRAGNLDVFNCLLRNRQVRLDVANKDGMTPLDLSWTMLPAVFYYGLNPRSIVSNSLLAAGAPYGGGRPELFTEKHIPKGDRDKEAKTLTEATQVMSIVTALIATVTFASAFTLPGGYRSADDKAGAAGTPVLAGSYAFDAFILADTLAFICSMAATYFLFYVGVSAVDISIRFRYLIISLRLMQSATRSLVAAFGLGLYLVVHHSASAIAACAIVFASSIYGNIEVWQVIRMATTILARTGIRRQRYALVDYARPIFRTVLTHFWSYLVIFGLPAIRKRVHSEQAALKWTM